MNFKLIRMKPEDPGTLAANIILNTWQDLRTINEMRKELGLRDV